MLQVTEWYSLRSGGVARHVREVAKRLNTDVLTTDRKAEDAIVIPAFKDPIFGTTISPLAKKLEGIFVDYDIIHVHHAFARLSLAAITAAKRLGKPVVLTNHTVSIMYDYELPWKVLNYTYPRFRLTLNKVDRIISVSKAAQRFIEYFVSKPNVIIPNGVDTSRFKPRDVRLFKGYPVILYVGRLAPKKGVDLLILSMKKVFQRYPEAHLVIAGTGKIGPLLKSLASPYPVTFLGFVPDEILPFVYNSADVFVLPSLTGESFGMVLLEAMASGLPVVATKVGGVPEVVGECGVLVDPNPNDIAEGIFLALGKKPCNAEAYSWDNVAKQIWKVYESECYKYGAR